jgi:hypothetical protein
MAEHDDLHEAMIRDRRRLAPGQIAARLDGIDEKLERVLGGKTR